MKNTFVGQCVLFIFGIVTSIILHVVFFQMFKITIPLISESYKPPITFLGSILSRTDIFAANYGEPGLVGNGPLSILEKPPETHGPAQKTFTPNTSKHQPTASLAPKTKKNLKATFLEEHKAPIKSSSDIGINLRSEPYTPLKLKSND